MKKEYKDSKRIKSGFLFFPKTLDTRGGWELEKRWLEFAKWEQMYVAFRSGGGYWRDLHWIDK